VNPRAPELNARSLALVETLIADADTLGIQVLPGSPGRILDFGIDTAGGLEAGVALAKVCLADLAEVSIVSGEIAGTPSPWVEMRTDHPVAACLASQYAGWAVQVDDYFAMGSGAMRAAYGGEKLFETVQMREKPQQVVGVLESRQIPTSAAMTWIAQKTGVNVDDVHLLVAPTASLAGGVQVVSRSVETALHKLHELEFDLDRVVSGRGQAPLPPVAKGDLEAIGRTNDCILYGATAWLWVRGDDASLEEIGPRVPSSSSSDHGRPFIELFERYDRDFYKIDPMLFSPARVIFQNIESGRTHVFGDTAEEVLARSLFSS